MSDRRDTRPRFGDQPDTPIAPNVPAAGMQEPEAAPDPYVGKLLLNRYFVQERLGEGGMGAVYRAQHTTLEKPVALKILHPEYSRKGELVERFLLEAKAASRIRHDNVIDIFDFGKTPEGSVFFAMEYLDGRELHDVLIRAKLQGEVVPWERTRPIFLQVCSALHAAHKQGVIHRDLKPENIYLVERLGKPDFVKLLDFGIAKLTEISSAKMSTGERKLTKTGMLFGTPEYMSPEQARGEKVDHRVDVYAMGCILYQMLTGRVPFEGDNFMGILSSHINDPPPPITPAELARVGAPTALARVMEKALAKDRDQRYPTMRELARAVRAASKEPEEPVEPVEPVEPPPRRRMRSEWTGTATLHDESPEPAKSSKGAIVALLIVVMLAAGGAAAYYKLVLPNRAEQAAQPAQVPPIVMIDAAPAVPASITLKLDTEPSGADVIDQQSGRVLGQTPLEYDMPGSLDARRFRFSLPDHGDKLLELVPSEDLQYKLKLTPMESDEPAVEPEVVVMPQKRRHRRRRRRHRTAAQRAALQPTADQADSVESKANEPKPDEPATKGTGKKATPEPSAQAKKAERKAPVPSAPAKKADEPKPKPKKPPAKAKKPKVKKATPATPGDVKLKNPFGT